MRLFLTTTLALFAAASVGLAAPITLTFNLQQTGSDVSTLTIFATEDPTYSIEVTALENGIPVLINRLGTDGLGVDSGPLDGNDLDGLGGIEALVFTPNFPLINARVVSMSFTNLDTTLDDDEAQVFLDNSSVFNGLLSTTVNSSSFSDDAFTSNVRVQATDNNDNFGVRQVVLEVEQVPEPTTITLFGVGLLALAYARRRR